MILPCKCMFEPDKRVSVFGCARCTGFDIGIAVFLFLMLFFRNALNFPKDWLLAATVILMLPSIVHGGIFRRYLNKTRDWKHSDLIVFLEGIFAAAAGFAFALWLI